MKKPDLELFRLSLEEVLTELGISDISTAPAAPSETVGALCSVGLTGELSGYLLLSTDSMSVTKLVQEMAAGLDGNNEAEFGPFGKAVFGELGNQVAGRVIMHLAEIGYDCNITPPTVITGQEVRCGQTDTDISVSFGASGAFGKLGFSITLKRRKDQ